MWVPDVRLTLGLSLPKRTIFFVIRKFYQPWTFSFLIKKTPIFCRIDRRDTHRSFASVDNIIAFLVLPRD